MGNLGQRDFTEWGQVHDRGGSKCQASHVFLFMSVVRALSFWRSKTAVEKSLAGVVHSKFRHFSTQHEEVSLIILCRTNLL
jgi:hypothetical protein